MKLSRRTAASSLIIGAAALLNACANSSPENPDPVVPETSSSTVEQAPAQVAEDTPKIHPDKWPVVETPPLDPNVEARIDEILAKLTLEQKVGQVIQGDSGAVTAEQVKKYRLGSVLSGGNSAPGPDPYADAQTWLEAADAYYEASMDP